MKELVAGLVTVATAFIGAGVAYQIVKPGSQAPQELQTVGTVTTNLGGDLFKG